MDLSPFLTFGTSLLGAVISAVLAVRLSLKRFYSEKLWERKLAGYTSVIEAIHHIREHAETNLSFSQRGRDLPPDGDKVLVKQLEEAMAELRKQRDIGSFVIAESAVTELNALLAGLEASTDTKHWEKHLELKLAAIDNSLPKLRRIARSDLEGRGAA